MGLSNSDKQTFVNVVEGKFCIRGKEGDPGVSSRVNKAGDTVFEHKYSSLSGRVKDIKFIEKDDYGRQISLTMEDGDDRYVLNVQMSSGAGMSLLKALPNVDFTKELTLNVWSKVIDDKPKTRIYLQHGSDKCEWFWTQEDKKDLPDLEQKKVKGKLVYDDSEQLEYIENYIINQVVPKLARALVNPPAEGKATAGATGGAMAPNPKVAASNSGRKVAPKSIQEQEGVEEESDLPF